MEKNNKALWLKLIGWAVLVHVILITISFIEVFIYSMIINPGQDQSVYNDHTAKSAPIVAIVFGIILFFLVARLLAKKRSDKRTFIGLMLAIFYIIIDLLVLIPFGVDWGKHYLVFILSFGTKLLAGFAGAYTIKVASSTS
ncbi:MAG: hypothetical protein AAF489_14710 [Bacteroidota bacterium]